MMRSRAEEPLGARLRQVIENARQKPLATALVLTLMLAALFAAYAMATSSGDSPSNTAQNESAAPDEGGFLSDGYAELESEESDDGGGVNWWGDVPGLLFRLAIVLGLAYGSLRLLNYFTRNGRLGGSHGRALEVVDHLNLGQNRSIYLVRVAGRVLVVGATGNQLNLLSRMAAEDLPEDVRTSAPNFTSQLQARILRQIGNGQEIESEEQIEKRRKMLRELREEEPVSPPA